MEAKSLQIFKYEKPNTDRVRAFVQLCKTDLAAGHVQILKERGVRSDNLHAHMGQDGFWFVLGGLVRFYGDGDKVLAELGKHEGVLIPRGFPYWFENASDEPLEILRLGSSAQDTENKRIDYTPRTKGGAQSFVGTPQGLVERDPPKY